MEKLPETEGLVFDIKRFAVRDGPGIRTSVFLKGCPLSCKWCHNPEGIPPEISIWYNQSACIACSLCVDSCPNEALALIGEDSPYIEIDRERCQVSGGCVEVCPTLAIQFTGQRITVAELMLEIEKDEVFYRSSGGGVTLTGGEPLYQPEFCKEILEACKTRKMHTALESCLHCERDALDLVLELVDLFIIDLKLFDPLQHEKYTGKTNEIIKDNITYLAGLKKNILVRVPLIDGITNTEPNKNALEEFVRQLDPVIPMEFLAYNPLARHKYRKLGIPYSIDH